MKFDDLDKRMRIYETNYDQTVLPKIYVVARIDGRNFTTFTKEVCDYEAPFDIRFRDAMVGTVKHLMDCGFKVVYGFTESDEISLLLHRDDNPFSRKLRKLNSILAGEASAYFTNHVGRIASFDCRISQLPTIPDVIDYFRWRNEDAHRNALSSHCYWALRKAGSSSKEATQKLEKKSTAQKNEILFNKGINFNELPNWQKRGVGLYWEKYLKQGLNPKTGETVNSERNRITIDYELPMKDEYSNYIETIIKNSHS
ncbi:MAG: tRNA(His) guanylyltransferase Thg1 family protein [Verrucomicrobiota bacterium]